ncbi:PD-(D/E)XK nuclease family protein [Natronorarus salvus]|uniref:PD-(D/E)XK nuclease family protein n=1 Tax=Natronorarus salvus TaxID=3117733 RepID=UPI002F2615AA
MCPPPTVLLGSEFQSLRQEAFNRAESLAGVHPESVLYIDDNANHHREITDAWAEDHPPLRLHLLTFSSVIQECYERRFGPADLLSINNRRQLIAQALRDIDGEVPLDDPHLHRESIMELFNALEADGYNTPLTIQSLIDSQGVSSEASETVLTAYERYATLRTDLLTDGLYTLGGAYERLLSDEVDIESLLSSVDVVVLSGFYELTTLQRAFIEKLAGSLPMVVILPAVDTDASVESGANEAIKDALEFYETLDAEFHQLKREQPTALSASAGAMYDPNVTGRIDLSDASIEWQTAATPDREIRQIAGQIRAKLADGVDPTEIVVAIPGLISYREHFQDYFEAADIPTALVVNKLLYQTAVGRAVLDLLELCTGVQRSDIFTQLLANPFVTLTHGLGTSEAELSRRARLLPTTDVEVFLSELDADTKAVLDDFLDACSEVSSLPGTDGAQTFETLIDRLGIEDALADLESEQNVYDAQMEHRSFGQIQQVLDSTAYVCELTDVDDPVELIDEELQTLRIPPPRQPTRGVVSIIGLEDAYLSSYSHLYLAGLTEADFPIRPDRPIYFQTLVDELSSLSFSQPRLEARYQFATLVSSADSVVLSTPKATFTDEPLLESSILDELCRVSTLEATEPQQSICTREDLQRAVNQLGSPTEMHAAVDAAIERADFTADCGKWLQAGTDCTANRASAGLTEHDAQIDPERIESLYPTAIREPYSPTRLKKYAQCGFKFYLNQVLDFDEPEEYNLEPDALELGSLLHDILERFFTELQSEQGEPVDLRAHSISELESKLASAAFVEIDDASLPYNDQFYRQWLEQLLAGLATPEENPYYGENRAHGGDDRGLLIRFLEEEYENRSDTPMLFEASLGVGADEEHLALETPSGDSITVRGVIDRAGVKADDDGAPEGIVYDYKTGNPKVKNTLDGIEFQLPLYAAAAKPALEKHYGNSIKTVDSGFYQIKPPATLSSTRSWTLRKYFDRTDEPEVEFERFHNEVIPERLGTIAAAIGDGVFHTTIVDEQTAGCRYCDFSEICDVRPHRRRDVVETITETENTVYVPEQAENRSYLKSLGGDADE